MQLGDNILQFSEEEFKKEIKPGKKYIKIF